MDLDTLNSRKIGQAFNAEQIQAARKLLIQSAIDVHERTRESRPRDRVERATSCPRLREVRR